MTALRSLIGSVTVHTDEAGGTVLDVEASTATLIDLAETKESPRPGVEGYFNRTSSGSVTVVAGTRFHLNLRRLDGVSQLPPELAKSALVQELITAAA